MEDFHHNKLESASNESNTNNEWHSWPGDGLLNENPGAGSRFLSYDLW